ncbi:hypothetical protein B7L65_11885 [Xanthomonas citri pv. citri]|nr:hypothetical protein B7L65_11885 [Xanthomonas citri pv. citri]
MHGSLTVTKPSRPCLRAWRHRSAAMPVVKRQRPQYAAVVVRSGILDRLDDSRFPIPDSRFPIPDSRFPIPDSRFPIPDSRFPIPDYPNPESRIPNPESRIPNPESRIPNPESRIPNPESHKSMIAGTQPIHIQDQRHAAVADQGGAGVAG